MRMWMIPPKKLCNKHLVAEHGEIHAAIGNLRHSGRWTRSLTLKGFLEPQNAVKRHNNLVKEMLFRGYKHKSKLDVKGVELPAGKVDVEKSVKDITERCTECCERLK